MKKLLAAFLVLGGVGFFGCAAETESDPQGDEQVEQSADGLKGGSSGTCAIKCAAPPDGCHYENARTSGPCKKLTCGTLVCDGNTI